MASPPFHFKKFSIDQTGVAHPMGTDSVLLGAWADVSGCRSVLDIGTGTGVVALMLAQRMSQTATASEAETRITGVEIHPASAECARRNFEASPWAASLEIAGMSVQDFVRNCTLRFDLIVSNPPFFSEKIVSPDESRRLGRSTVALSPDYLLSVAKALLEPGGRLCVILPERQGRRLCERAVTDNMYCTEEMAVRSRSHKPVERLLLRFERNPYLFQKKELVVFGEGNVYTPDYKELTGAFYLQ